MRITTKHSVYEIDSVLSRFRVQSRAFGGWSDWFDFSSFLVFADRLWIQERGKKDLIMTSSIEKQEN